METGDEQALAQRYPAGRRSKTGMTMTADGSTSVRTERELTKEGFDRLLAWLDEDREKAAEKYEEIRNRLMKVFESRGCASPDRLADETIDRVARRIHEVAATYEGKPVLYFHGVARLVHLEYLRRRPLWLPTSIDDTPEEIEERYDCLEQCLNRLTPRNRELILDYYDDKRQTGTDPRKQAAWRLGISPNALRIRAHRIRESLGKCIGACLTLKGPN